MEIIFLGKSKCIPDEIHGDTPCFIVNKKYLVDLGYKSTLTLADVGIDPNNIKHVFVTHCHHDHIIGLPLFLFYKIQTKKTTAHIFQVLFIATAMNMKYCYNFLMEIVQEN